MDRLMQNVPPFLQDKILYYNARNSVRDAANTHPRTPNDDAILRQWLSVQLVGHSTLTIPDMRLTVSDVQWLSVHYSNHLVKLNTGVREMDLPAAMQYLGQLTNLTTLELHGQCRLFAWNPDWKRLSSLTSLQTLSLLDITMESWAISSLARLSASLGGSLRCLRLINVKLSDEHLSDIKKTAQSFGHLIELDLSDNDRISGTKLDELLDDLPQLHIITALGKTWCMTGASS